MIVVYCCRNEIDLSLVLFEAAFNYYFNLLCWTKKLCTFPKLTRSLI